jgi:paraquat-inducible protein A
MRTAQDMGLWGCARCTRVSPAGTSRCPRCGSRLSGRWPGSLSKVWAWWFAGLICYFPANLYPMLETSTLGQTQSDTIVGGAIELADHGNYGVAAIILIASVLIPVSKFLVIAGLAIGVMRRPALSEHLRHRGHEIVEYIGRWSMIDVFVVAILSSLVQLKALAVIEPGPAALFFALSVIFTMLSAQAFDPRLIWDSGPPPAADDHARARPRVAT